MYRQRLPGWPSTRRPSTACGDRLCGLYAPLGRGVVQPGSTLASGARGRRFESSRPDQVPLSLPDGPQHEPADREHPRDAGDQPV